MQREQVAAVLPAMSSATAMNDLERRVAGAGAHAGERRVDAGRALLDGDERVGHAERQVLVGVDADSVSGFEHLAIGPDAFAARRPSSARPPESVT